MEESGVAAYRGVVYGYYGRLWDQREWYVLMDSMARWKANFILYGPKDDPYHREKWRVPYPEREALFMADLVVHAKEKGMWRCRVFLMYRTAV